MEGAAERMSYYRIYHYPFGTQYKHVYFKGGRPTGPAEAAEREDREEADRLEESLCRSRRLLRDYVLCNKWDLFCTFTFDMAKVNRYDYKECSAVLRKFFNNYRNRYSSDFRYIVIPEFHKDGAIHFHGFVRGIRPDDLYVPEMIQKRVGGQLVDIPNTRQYVRWKNYSYGNFDCSAIRSIEAAAHYAVKYITKNLMALPKGLKVVLHSANLQKPELILDMDDLPCFKDKPDFVGDYCVFKFTYELYGILPDYWNESCSEVRRPDAELDEYPFEAFTGEQLKIRVGPFR